MSTDITLLPALQRPAMYPLVGLQMVLTALTYLGFFALQKRSNPVFLSQMGCIAALVGLLLGLVFFDEQYAAGVWLGVLIVLLGLWLTNAPAWRQKQWFRLPVSRQGQALCA